MAGDVAKGLFFLSFILWGLGACCSGTLVGLSVDAGRGSGPTKAQHFLKRIGSLSSPIRVLSAAADHNAQLGSPSSTTGVPLDLHVNNAEEGKEEGEAILPSSRRGLLSHGSSHPTSATKTARHDIITNPVTTGPVNPVTTGPVTTFPSTPGIITVPSTNPVTVLPNTGPAVSVPSTVPVVNPIPVPATNPATTPITVPSTIPAPPPPAGVVPITNPLTTPSAPITPPLTNPVTTYPFPPPGNIPFAPVTGGVPATVPVSPAVAGQTWCVARTGAMDAALQVALDYACGIGGADCSAIQQTGSCYNPNTLRDHSSYAFNSYYSRNPSPTSCDFGGTAMLVNTNPSTATCTYAPGSPGAPVFNTYNPTGTNPTNPTGTNPTGSSTVFGSNNPIGSVNPTSTTTPSNSSSLSAGMALLFSLLVVSLHVTRWPL